MFGWVCHQPCHHVSPTFKTQSTNINPFLSGIPRKPASVRFSMPLSLEYVSEQGDETSRHHALRNSTPDRNRCQLGIHPMASRHGGSAKIDVRNDKTFLSNTLMPFSLGFYVFSSSGFFVFRQLRKRAPISTCHHRTPSSAYVPHMIRNQERNELAISIFSLCC